MAYPSEFARISFVMFSGSGGTEGSALHRKKKSVQTVTFLNIIVFGGSNRCVVVESSRLGSEYSSLRRARRFCHRYSQISRHLVRVPNRSWCKQTKRVIIRTRKAAQGNNMITGILCRHHSSSERFQNGSYICDLLRSEGIEDRIRKSAEIGEPTDKHNPEIGEISVTHRPPCGSRGVHIGLRRGGQMKSSLFQPEFEIPQKFYSAFHFKKKKTSIQHQKYYNNIFGFFFLIVPVV